MLLVPCIYILCCLVSQLRVYQSLHRVYCFPLPNAWNLQWTWWDCGCTRVTECTGTSWSKNEIWRCMIKYRKIWRPNSLRFVLWYLVMSSIPITWSTKRKIGEYFYGNIMFPINVYENKICLPRSKNFSIEIQKQFCSTSCIFICFLVFPNVLIARNNIFIASNVL